MKVRSGGTVTRIASPLWGLVQRFYFLLLVLAAISLMMIGRLEPALVDQARARVTDAVSPILDLFSRPAATVANGLEQIRHWIDLHGENIRLRQENARLIQWQQAALRLDAENRSLRSLLAFKPDPAISFITARVVADPGGAFVRTLVITAGRRDGVKRGQAAIAGRGLIGRVVQVGEWSSRLLLLTDLNARIPVVLESSRQRAMLAGDNTDLPQLLYVPLGVEIAEGERVFTSGHGGIFPPGLPVGTVTFNGVAGADGQVSGKSELRVVPMAVFNRLEHVQLVDFAVPGGLAAEAVHPGAMN